MALAPATVQCILPRLRRLATMFLRPLSAKLTRAAARPVMRRAAGDRDVPSRPSARSRGLKPAPHFSQ